jgi:hypothetical protein
VATHDEADAQLGCRFGLKRRRIGKRQIPWAAKFPITFCEKSAGRYGTTRCDSFVSGISNRNDSAAGHAEVTAELRKLLPLTTYRLTTLDVQAESSRDTLDALRGKPGLFTVAIGQPAATFARDQLKGPVPFCPGLQLQELMVDGRSIRGVAALPPLDLQIQDWKKLDPQIRTIGLIVSKSHTDLIAQGELAAKASPDDNFFFQVGASFA